MRLGGGWAVGACNVSATRCGRAFGLRQAAGAKGLGSGASASQSSPPTGHCLMMCQPEQHGLRCVHVTDAADTIVEICVVSGRGASSIYLLLGTGRIVS